MAEKPGRPRVLVRRHVLEIKEDTQAFIEAQINKLIGVRVAGKGIEAAGEVLKGAVSHPIGFAAVSAAITLYFLGLTGGSKEKQQEAVNEFKRLINEHTGINQELLDAWELTIDLTQLFFPFLPLVPDVGIPPVKPLTEHEIACGDLSRREANAEAALIGATNPDIREQIQEQLKEIREAQFAEGC